MQTLMHRRQHHRVGDVAAGVTARSVIFDIADNWGDGSWMGIRSIEFKLNGSVIALTPSDFAAYGNQHSSGYGVANAFDTTKPKSGGVNGNAWQVNASSNTRIIVVFNAEQSFDEIVINNFYSSSHGDGARGARNVRITRSPDEVTDTTYNAAVSNGTVLNDAEWPMATGTEQDQTVWVASAQMVATGGTITDIPGYRIHTFTEDGAFEVTAGEGEVEYLIVAGGGGGSFGGGGAGGLLAGTISVSPQAYPVVVGAGGLGSPTSGTDNTNGGDSWAFGIFATGGGKGGRYSSSSSSDCSGGDGGSGGGGGAKDTPSGNGNVSGGLGVAGQGHDGGRGESAASASNRDGAGGGGAGEPGYASSAADNRNGDGGNGVESSITGTATYYAGGGGGDAYSGDGGLGGGGNKNEPGVDGLGGGGGYRNNGGSGVVIIRYPI
jgi:hypothetical protein